MKKILLYLSAVALIMALFLTDCKKKPELKIYNLEISDENVLATATNATITATYSFPTEIRNIKVAVSDNNNLQNANVFDANLDNNTLSATIENLSASTNYYYCFRYSNGINLVDTDVRNFKTQEASLPSVSTSEVSNITMTSAISGGNITSDGGATITERGICWSTSHNPTISNNHTSNGIGIGSYSVNIDGLTANTTYYVRAYAKNNVGIAYGAEVSFKTSENPTVPVVTTSNITNITQTSATGGGNVTSTGGSNVSQRGICWSTSQNPTTNDNHVTSGVGVGNFTCNMTGLTSNITYYVRAYAINEVGVAYGEQKSFITGSNVTNPTVTTNNVTNITTSSATCGGVVTSDGGATVTARGVCWSTSETPTISDNHTWDGTGTGMFSRYITGLMANTTYYVRAYATNEVGTSYGEQKTFTTLSGGPGNVPTGAINGLFSVSATQQVYFSQGNLQYQASTNTWRFASNQGDYIGAYNQLLSYAYDGWIDLFGWGTSGYNHGAVCYQPWSSSQDNGDYLAYGEASYNLYDQTGQADWGYNQISNGGIQGNLWRTLTIEEWIYIINTRSTNSGIRFAKAKINDIDGVIILPDNWDNSIYNLNNTNDETAEYMSNVINSSEWNIYFESNGSVFLPAAGYRSGTTISNSMGAYWSSSIIPLVYAIGTFEFDNSTFYQLSTTHGAFRYQGCSVRLVQNAE